MLHIVFLVVIYYRNSNGLFERFGGFYDRK